MPLLSAGGMFRARQRILSDFHPYAEIVARVHASCWFRLDWLLQ